MRQSPKVAPWKLGVGARTVEASLPPHDPGGLAADSKILGHELFGPVAAIVPFEDLDEVIVQANDTPYGLIAYVYGRDLGRTLAIAEQLEVGMVGINRGLSLTRRLRSVV